MSFAAGRPVLAIPGPSPVPDRVLRAMHRPSPDIYGGELTGLNLRVMADLKRLAGTVQHVAPYIGNGHAAWEAANMNLFAPGDRALVLVSGHFGSSWANTAEAMGVQVERMEAEPFAAVDAQTRMSLQEELGRIAARAQITVVFITHSVEEAIFLGDRVAVMTTGPGRVHTIVDVPFPRAERSWAALNADPDFAALRQQLLEMIRVPPTHAEA